MMIAQDQPALAECRLLIDPSSCGAWNMAVDEMLLEWAAEEGGCCWRFYRWDRPTLSLGYFQEYVDRREHAASRNCPVVRRLTGGGAILHDAELTYSLVVHGEHPLAAKRHRLYRTVHETLIEALAELGIAATLHGTRANHRGAEDASFESRGSPARDRPPFLCFGRRSNEDVVFEGTKIAGSAQRRRRGAVLQHGSVLLRGGPDAPELAGLEDLSGKAVDAHRLVQVWLEALSGRVARSWRHEPLSERQQAQATALMENRYECAGWTERRQRDFAEIPKVVLTSAGNIVTIRDGD